MNLRKSYWYSLTNRVTAKETTMTKRNTILHTRVEISNIETAMKEFRTMVYVEGYIPCELHIAKYKRWQRELDLLKEELNLVSFGCSLNYKGFNWVDIFNYYAELKDRSYQLAANYTGSALTFKPIIDKVDVINKVDMSILTNTPLIQDIYGL